MSLPSTSWMASIPISLTSGPNNVLPLAAQSNWRTALGDRKPSAVLQFDCAARGKTLFGPEVKEMGIDAIQDVLGKDIPWVGFYTYGELAPIGGKNYAHTATVALCVIC